MKLFGFRINAGEIKDVREIEKTLENIEEKKNKIIDLAGQLSTLTEIKFKYSADGSIEKKFEVDGFEMDKILGNMRVAQMQIVDSYKSLEALGMIEITPAPKNRGKTLLLENFWRNIAEKMLKKSWNRSEKRKLCKLKKRADARGASTQVHM